MNVVIVDDEPPARVRLKRMIEGLPGWSVVAEAGNGREALGQIEKLTPDVVLLDVRMPGIDGLETARHLAEWGQPPAVIFTTAYDDYALEAFDAEAVDYLLKPVRLGRLEDALKKAKRINRVQASALALNKGKDANVRTHISARHRGGLTLIPLDEILYFRADSKYIEVRHLNGEVLIDETLKALEEEFSDRFIRVHRNAIVQSRWVNGIDREGNISFREIDDTVEVSRANLAQVKRILAGN